MVLEMKSPLIIGLDVSGDPRSNEENELIENEIKKAKSNGLKIAAHIGETKESLQTAPSLLSLTDRIGHGTCLDFDSIQMIPFELCPTSNVLSKTVSSYEAHHFGRLFKREWPLCICTDDKGVFNTSLSNEYYQLTKAFNLTKQQLCQITKDSIELIFDDDTKEKLREIFDKLC